MRATIGILLIFGGLLLGYAILSGKFPPASSSTNSSDNSTSAIAGGIAGGIKSIIPLNDPLGLPTVKALASTGDKPASTGGMS